MWVATSNPWQTGQGRCVVRHDSFQVAALVIALLVPVAGCGHKDPGKAGLAGPAGATSSPAPTVSPTRDPADAAPSPSPSVGSHSVVRLMEADSGRTRTVHAGTKIQLVLNPTAGSYDPPPVDRSGVLGEDGHHGGFSESTTAVADFTALTSGTATGTSQTDVGCLHSTPRCLPPQRGFTLAVMVG